jgi:hypothetical protein
VVRTVRTVPAHCWVLSACTEVVVIETVAEDGLELANVWVRWKVIACTELI